MAADLTFIELRDRRRRVVELCESQVDALQRFHQGANLAELAKHHVEIKGFSLNPVGDADDRLSISSTATCVRSLLASPFIGPNADYRFILDELEKRATAKQLDTRGLDHGNVYTLGQLLPTLSRMTSTKPRYVRPALRSLEKEVKKDGVCIAGQPFPANGFLTYWALVALQSWGSFDADASSPSLKWSEAQLYRQLALFGAADDEADPYQLGYNLLIQRRFQRDTLRDSVLASALNSLFSAMLPGGLWEKKEPLFRYGDEGDAHPFTFELLNAILLELGDVVELLAPHEHKLEQSLRWATRNAYGGEHRLWRSGHLADKKEAESWATAEVYCYLQNYRAFLAKRVLVKVRYETGRGRAARKPNPTAFSSLCQPSVRLDATEQLIGDVLAQKMLDPLRVHGGSSYSLARSPLKTKLPRSGIFFGPPGTGKTTYAAAVADYLGWPMITITPADFAAEGLLLLPTVGRRLFDKLVELEDVVIFFDEMEELMHDRGDGTSFEQRFLTTSFLPSLQDLRDRASCIYIVATNKVEDLDPAARAPRRFDFQLGVLPPAIDEKRRLIEERLETQSLPSVNEQIEQHKEEIRWATFGEMMNLLSRLATDPDNAEHTVSEFTPTLYPDRTKWEVEEKKMSAFYASA